MDETHAKRKRSLLNCLLGRGLVSQSIVQRLQNPREPYEFLFIGVRQDFNPRASSYHGPVVNRSELESMMVRGAAAGAYESWYRSLAERSL